MNFVIKGNWIIQIINSQKKIWKEKNTWKERCIEANALCLNKAFNFRLNDSRWAWWKKISHSSFISSSLFKSVWLIWHEKRKEHFRRFFFPTLYALFTFFIRFIVMITVNEKFTLKYYQYLYCLFQLKYCIVILTIAWRSFNNSLYFCTYLF